MVHINLPKDHSFDHEKLYAQILLTSGYKHTQLQDSSYAFQSQRSVAIQNHFAHGP